MHQHGGIDLHPLESLVTERQVAGDFYLVEMNGILQGLGEYTKILKQKKER